MGVGSAVSQASASQQKQELKKGIQTSPEGKPAYIFSVFFSSPNRNCTQVCFIIQNSVDSVKKQTFFIQNVAHEVCRF